MSFQTAVNTYPVKGIAGQIATLNPASFFPHTTLASASITIGTAVFYNPTTNTVSNAASSSGVLAGIAAQVLDYVDYDALSEASMTITKGQAVSILARGDIYVTATSSVSHGDYVFASTSTGALTFSSSATAATGTVLTSFKATSAASSGDIVMISA